MRSRPVAFGAVYNFNNQEPPMKKQSETRKRRNDKLVTGRFQQRIRRQKKKAERAAKPQE
jgi:hypothetical protein